jgi:hypothetical protein
VIAWSKGKPKSGDTSEGGGATFKPCEKWSKTW